MHDELTARQRAISLRLAGQPVKRICSALGRCEAWFHRWWRRYLEAGPEGLYDLSRANHLVAQHIPPELDRAILSIRRRLQAHATPATRYSLIGAAVILAELKALGIRPLPCERTIERVLERNGLTAPRVRLAPLAVLHQVVEQTPPPIRALNPDVPLWLEELIARLMAKNPADRFQSAAEVAALLAGCAPPPPSPLFGLFPKAPPTRSSPS